MWQNWHSISTCPGPLGTYGEKMSKPVTIVVTGAVGFAVILIVVVIVSTVITRIPDTPPDKHRLAHQALTPEEITLSLAPQTDGTLHVSECLVFDASESEDGPISWFIGGEQIGWERYGPAEVDDPFHDSSRYEFTHPNPPSEDSQWRPGRHIIGISYVLDDVYLDIAGQEFFVLPLSCPDWTHEATSVRTISLTSGGPIRCLPNNRDFTPDDECSSLSERRLDKDGTRLTWRWALSGSLDAVGFDASENMQVEPRPAPELEDHAVVRITLDADEADLVEPEIDSTK